MVGGEGFEEGAVAEDEFGGGVGEDAGGEGGGAGGVEGDDEDAAEEAGEEDGDPGGGVFAPEEEAVAGGEGAAVELGGDAAGEGGELAVGGGVAAVAAVGDDGDLRWVQEEVCDETGEVGAHAPMIAAAAGLASKSAGRVWWFGVALEEGGLAALDAHLSDDEAVAKMGHPVRMYEFWVKRCERWRMQMIAA